jgi:hypothetical protein
MCNPWIIDLPFNRPCTNGGAPPQMLSRRKGYFNRYTGADGPGGRPSGSTCLETDEQMKRLADMETGQSLSSFPVGLGYLLGVYDDPEAAQQRLASHQGPGLTILPRTVRRDQRPGDCIRLTGVDSLVDVVYVTGRVEALAVQSALEYEVYITMVPGIASSILHYPCHTKPVTRREGCAIHWILPNQLA